MSKSIFEDREIDVPCLECDYRTPKTLGWLSDHTKLTCGGCGAEITINNEHFRAELARADKGLSDFTNTIPGFRKR